MHRRPQHLAAIAVLVALSLMLIGCDTYSETGDPGQPAPDQAVQPDEPAVDPTPERLDGSSSMEFEDSDIDRANSASQDVQDYCSDAVSEAQEVGCLSHLDESDIP